MNTEIHISLTTNFLWKDSEGLYNPNRLCRHFVLLAEVLRKAKQALDSEILYFESKPLTFPLTEELYNKFYREVEKLSATTVGTNIRTVTDYSAAPIDLA